MGAYQPSQLPDVAPTDDGLSVPRPLPLRVLVVTVVHTPLDARIHHRQIRALRAGDVEVTYVAPWRATGTAPDEVATGVQALDVPRAVGRNRFRALAAARGMIARLGPSHDLVLLHDPELLLAVAGRLPQLPPVVLDVHEDLVASLPDRPWVPAVVRPLARFVARRLERYAERNVSLLLAEHAYQQRFEASHPVVPNLPWVPASPPPAGSVDRVVHVGRLSVGRGARELVAVGAALRAVDGPRLELVGPADDDVVSPIRAAHERGDLVWHGYLQSGRALDIVAGSVAGLALLHDLPNYRSSLPTKVVEYLAHGVPAIVTPLPLANDVVGSSGGGVVVDFGDVTATVDTVRRLAADPEQREGLGAAGRAWVAAEHSWDATAPAFVAELRRLAGRP